jgi:hypothetical protein
MADVVLMCVRSDIERAEALAEMFDDFGFSVSDCTDDTTLRGCGAGVVLWSEAARTSAELAAVVARVMATGKGVVLNFTREVAPEGAALCFDLTAWNGDPDDAALDRMFFAMDRMIVAARAGRLARVSAATAPARTTVEPLPVKPRAAPAPALRTMAASLVVIGAVLAVGIAIGRAAPAQRAIVNVPAEYAQSVRLGDVAPVNMRYDLDARVTEQAPVGRRGLEPPSADR